MDERNNNNNNHTIVMRPHDTRIEWNRCRVSKDDHHYVVANVALPFDELVLLRALLAQRNERRDVEHDLCRFPLRVHRELTRGGAFDVEASVEASEALEWHPCAQKVQKLLKLFACPRY